MAMMDDQSFEQFRYFRIKDKLRKFLGVCLEIELPDNAPILQTLKRVFDRRNRLMHAVPIDANQPAEHLYGDDAYAASEEWVQDMNLFFDQLAQVAPITFWFFRD